jgi:hypothetical protein
MRGGVVANLLDPGEDFYTLGAQTHTGRWQWLSVAAIMWKNLGGHFWRSAKRGDNNR